jgi:hypothetical protein
MKTIHSFAFCFLLFILSSCQSSLLTDLAAAPGERLYWDDFTDTSGGWPVYTSSESAFAYGDGAYRISVTSPAFQTWALSGHAYRDVQVEADATRLAGPQANLYGLVCRSLEEANFYFFIISSDGYYAIGKVSNGEASLLGQEMMAYSAAIALGEAVNHLRFDCIGSTLTGYINGQMVAVTDDSAFRSGDAGLIAGTFDEGGVEISFDNFVVYKP